MTAAVAEEKPAEAEEADTQKEQGEEEAEPLVFEVAVVGMAAVAGKVAGNLKEEAVEEQVVKRLVQGKVGADSSFAGDAAVEEWSVAVVERVAVEDKAVDIEPLQGVTSFLLEEDRESCQKICMIQVGRRPYFGLEALPYRYDARVPTPLIHGRTRLEDERPSLQQRWLRTLHKIHSCYIDSF